MPWLDEADRDGYERRAALAALIAARYGIDERAILADLPAGMIDQLSPDPAVAEALTEVVSAGFVPYVVTTYRPTLTAETAPIALRQLIHVPAPEAHR